MVGKRSSKVLYIILFFALVIGLFTLIRLVFSVIGKLLFYGLTLAVAIALALLIIGYLKGRGKGSGS